MSNQITAKLLAAGFSQLELDAPADCDRLLLGLVGDGATLDRLQEIACHFGRRRRFELAFQRCKLLGSLVWSNEVDKYVRAS